MPEFQNGDLVIIEEYTGLRGLEWTVVDVEMQLLGCIDFRGHSGDREKYSKTRWENHCWHVRKDVWISAGTLIQENE